MTSLFDWAQAYLNYAEAQFSRVTYDEKRSMFKRFFQDIDPNLPVSELTEGRVMKYITEQKKKRSGYAANKDRKNLVSAWNWGMVYMTPKLPGPNNPCRVVKVSEVRSPRYVPPEEDFRKVYDLADGQDKVMLLTFLHLAARRGEVFRLKWEDVDFVNDRIGLWTKKRKGGDYEYDWLPLTKVLKQALLWWQDNRPMKDVPYVFVCIDDENRFCKESYGKPFKYRIHFMGRLCDRAKVKRFDFHSIRHLTASTLYKLGYTVGKIQVILRHMSPNTTERYLKKLGFEMVRPALEDLSHQKGGIREFRPERVAAHVIPFRKEKAVSGAVNP